MSSEQRESRTGLVDFCRTGSSRCARAYQRGYLWAGGCSAPAHRTSTNKMSIIPQSWCACAHSSRRGTRRLTCAAGWRGGPYERNRGLSVRAPRTRRCAKPHRRGLGRWRARCKRHRTQQASEPRAAIASSLRGTDLMIVSKRACPDTILGYAGCRMLCRACVSREDTAARRNARAATGSATRACASVSLTGGCSRHRAATQRVCTAPNPFLSRATGRSHRIVRALRGSGHGRVGRERRMLSDV